MIFSPLFFFFFWTIYYKKSVKDTFFKMYSPSIARVPLIRIVAFYVFDIFRTYHVLGACMQFDHCFIWEKLLQYIYIFIKILSNHIVFYTFCPAFWQHGNTVLKERYWFGRDSIIDLLQEWCCIDLNKLYSDGRRGAATPDFSVSSATVYPWQLVQHMGESCHARQWLCVC